jgi:hypothetical protein
MDVEMFSRAEKNKVVFVFESHDTAAFGTEGTNLLTETCGMRGGRREAIKETHTYCVQRIY